MPPRKFDLLCTKPTLTLQTATTANCAVGRRQAIRVKQDDYQITKECRSEKETNAQGQDGFILFAYDGIRCDIDRMD